MHARWKAVRVSGAVPPDKKWDPLVFAASAEAESRSNWPWDMDGYPSDHGRKASNNHGTPIDNAGLTTSACEKCHATC